MEDEDDDDGSSIEEEEEVPVQGQAIETAEHREHQASGVALGPIAGSESVPAYSQPARGSNVEIGSNGYAVSAPFCYFSIIRD